MSQVLIVDDSQTERTRLQKIVQDEGHQVRTAENGLLALKSVKEIKPDFILMDVNMPEMDGFAATRALRGDAETKNIPVILVTSKDQKADKAWGKMLGAKGYITKPYTDKDVVSLIRSIQ